MEPANPEASRARSDPTPWVLLRRPRARRLHGSGKEPAKKGGDFKLNGKPYDLAKGTLLLVATKGGAVRVTQLDVDLSKVEPNEKGFQGLAKKHEKLAKFLADASEQK